jgi:hypothetical protein|uniref:SAP domain-containing protein n=1 Tax=viral metagenome TaxID=1070528 RepID=A0A6C0LVQ2_9ZZZZ
MYSFIFDQTYINLMILIMIVFLVMFLWRKIIILEGNFFILEKRVNLIKKDVREDSFSKNFEKSETIMNEIFKDYCPANACKSSGCFPSVDDNECIKSTKITSNNLHINEDMVKYISSQTPDDINDNTEKIQEIEEITFTNKANIVKADNTIDGNNTIDVDNTVEDIDKMVNSIISSSEEYEGKVTTEQTGLNDKGDHELDNISITSDITFTSDDKKNDGALHKKYSKMSLDKLKELCNTNDINIDGTKNQLIARLIENRK